MKINQYKWIVTGLLLAASVVYSGCGGSPETRVKPNILLISVDTLRRDHVSAYGYPRPTTPMLDKLATEGVLFEYAVSRSSWTLPAHMSILTGLSPSQHKVEERGMQLPKKVVTLAEILRKQGYYNGGFATVPLLSRHYGFARGFDDYEVLSRQRGEKVTRRAIKWLSAAAPKERPFFLFLHYFDVHWPYGPPEKYLRMFDLEESDKKYGEWEFLKKFSYAENEMSPGLMKKIISLYDGEIRYTDDQIRRLVDYLDQGDLLDNTIIVILSDHGEEFREHGNFGHGHTFYREVIDVPLVIRYPQKIPARTRISRVVTTSDIPNMLMDLTGIPSPAQFNRDSPRLTELMRQEGKKDLPRAIVVESTDRGPKRFAIIKDRFKYMPSSFFHAYRIKKSDKKIWYKTPAGLYDWLHDPGEQRNLLSSLSKGDSAGKKPGQQVLATYPALKAELSAFIRNNAQGLEFSFVPLSDSLDHYQGFIRFDGELLDEPFRMNFQEGDGLSPQVKAREYQFEVRIKANKKGLFFAPTDNIKKITLHIERNNRLFLEDTIPLPVPGQVIQLTGKKGSEAFLILARRNLETRRSKAKKNLSREQIEHLKSLGYL